VGRVRSHWYEPTGTTLRITKVDDTHTRALEIDGKPARSATQTFSASPSTISSSAHRMGSRRDRRRCASDAKYFLRALGSPSPTARSSSRTCSKEDSELDLMRIGDMVGYAKVLRTDIPDVWRTRARRCSSTAVGASGSRAAPGSSRALERVRPRHHRVSASTCTSRSIAVPPSTRRSRRSFSVRAHERRDQRAAAEVARLQVEHEARSRIAARAVASYQQRALQMEIIRQQNEDLDRLAGDLSRAKKLEEERPRDRGRPRG